MELSKIFAKYIAVVRKHRATSTARLSAAYKEGYAERLACELI